MELHLHLELLDLNRLNSNNNNNNHYNHHSNNNHPLELQLLARPLLGPRRILQLVAHLEPLLVLVDLVRLVSRPQAGFLLSDRVPLLAHPLKQHPLQSPLEVNHQLLSPVNRVDLVVLLHLLLLLLLLVLLLVKAGSVNHQLLQVVSVQLEEVSALLHPPVQLSDRLLVVQRAVLAPSGRLQLLQPTLLANKLHPQDSVLQLIVHLVDLVILLRLPQLVSVLQILQLRLILQTMLLVVSVVPLLLHQLLHLANKLQFKLLHSVVLGLLHRHKLVLLAHLEIRLLQILLLALLLSAHLVNHNNKLPHKNPRLFLVLVNRLKTHRQAVDFHSINQPPWLLLNNLLLRRLYT